LGYPKFNLFLLHLILNSHVWLLVYCHILLICLNLGYYLGRLLYNLVSLLIWYCAMIFYLLIIFSIFNVQGHAIYVYLRSVLLVQFLLGVMHYCFYEMSRYLRDLRVFFFLYVVKSSLVVIYCVVENWKVNIELVLCFTFVFNDIKSG
jgi:hypothetical protein